MSLAPGTRLGRYEIRSLLGVGGMGEVYRAKDPKLDRDVAIKILSSDVSRDADRLRRFEQEASAAGALNHPGILSIFDVASQGDTPYVVSELLEGESLRMRLHNQPLSARKTIDYALQIAKGLSAAHEKAIVHRDLKPENLFVTKDGRIKILDFGLAKLIDPVEEDSSRSVLPTRSALTKPGTIIGTVAYMSPEQVRGQSIDHRTDIFSLGIVMYEMLSGNLPFSGPSSVETMNAILKNEPRDLSESGLTIPPALDRIIKRCLEKNPGERFQSSTDLAFALETLSGVSDSQRSTHLEQRKKVSHRNRWLAAAFLCAAVLIAVIVMSFRSSQESRTLGMIRLPVMIPQGLAFHYDVETHNLAISPDGHRLVFVATSNGQKMLWMRSLNDTPVKPIEGTQGAVSPFWSPDSQYIAFFAAHKLKKIDASGGPPQTLCDLSSDAEDRAGAWLSDGTIFFSEPGDNPNKGVFRIPASGGTASRAFPFKDFGFYWIDFLPDGKHLLIPGLSETNWGINVAEVDSWKARMLLPAPSRVEYASGFLLYAREGALVAHPFDAKRLRFTGEPFVVAQNLPYFDKTGWAEFSVSDTGVLVYMSDLPKTQLVWYDRKGRELGQLGSSNRYFYIRLSPDEQYLAIGISDPQTFSGDLWIHDLKRETRTRFVFGPADDADPVWSPDGNELAYFSCCEEKSTLHIKNKNETGKGRLALPIGFNTPLDWSRDGKFLIYTEGSPLGNLDLWILPLQKDSKSYPFVQTHFNENYARFSPDGRWVAYVCNESGQDDVYVSRFENPRERWRISTAGGAVPRWRGDGKELFYVAANNNLMAVPVASGNSFESAVPSVLFRMDSALDNQYEVTADGQRFLINKASTSVQSTPFNIVVNWALAKKR